jgi:prevent-host-death family protein
MTHRTTDEAAQRFRDLVQQVAAATERIVLTDDGQELAAVVPIEDVRLLQDMEDRLDVAEELAAVAEAEEHGTVPWKQIEVGLNRRTG